MTRIRDFIYLDVEKLYSLYSQVFEGVADQIIQSFVDSSTHKNVEGGSIFKGGDLETEIVEISRRTENKFLFDHMYTRLEEKLKPSIIDEKQITSLNFQDITSKALLVKVFGTARIMDFERLRNFTEDYDYLTEALTYISNFSSGELVNHRNEISRLEFLISKIKDKNQKTRSERELTEQENAYWRKFNELKKKLNLYIDHDLLEYISTVTQKFYFDNFELMISSSEDLKIGYRAILDKKWLRLQPNLFQSLFGSNTSSELVLIGQITYFPSKKVELIKSNKEDKVDIIQSMRDSYESFIEVFREFEKITSESAKRMDLVMWPIAIYRETELANPEKSEVK